LNPVKSYFDPLDLVMPDSNVDNGLENMFSLESIVIKGTDELSSIEEDQIEKFKNNIEFKNGFYHVSLPWYEDKINKVDSNHRVALAVVNKVVQNLTSRGLYGDYTEVFHQYLTDGIIEKINVDPSDYHKYVWIPHRPVVKMQDQVTTKVRPVFNCSLKTSSSPSLNESAFTGIDLMTSLLRLLLIFRTNKIALIADIKKAFLMIKLKEEADANRFCFFWRKDGELICYRYKTIVFGYTSSPFILNYIVKHHVEQYPQDECSKILGSQFYVDNLILTGNNLMSLKSIYETSYERMMEGGFNLRSWNTNDIELRDILTNDGNIVQHGCVEEKILGYRYNTVKDTMHIAQVEFLSNIKTKKQLLSEHSKLFDPLGLVLPVQVQGRLLIRELWALKYDWDVQMSPELKLKWQKLVLDYRRLQEI